MVKKNNKTKIVNNKDGFIEVPTYLFPEKYEYSKEVTPELKLKKNNKLKK